MTVPARGQPAHDHSRCPLASSSVAEAPMCLQNPICFHPSPSVRWSGEAGVHGTSRCKQTAGHTLGKGGILLSSFPRPRETPSGTAAAPMIYCWRKACASEDSHWSCRYSLRSSPQSVRGERRAKSSLLKDRPLSRAEQWESGRALWWQFLPMT